jgi:hypothetical protein
MAHYYDKRVLRVRIGSSSCKSTIHPDCPGVRSIPPSVVAAKADPPGGPPLPPQKGDYPGLD